MTIVLDRSLIKYLAVGITAFVIEYGTFYFLYMELGISLIVANSVSFFLGLLTSFAFNRLWTFGKRTYSKNTSHQLLLYFMLAFINLLLTNITVEILIKINIIPSIGKLAAMILTSLWNYVLFKRVIFKHHRSQEGLSQ